MSYCDLEDLFPTWMDEDLQEEEKEEVKSIAEVSEQDEEEHWLPEDISVQEPVEMIVPRWSWEWRPDDGEDLEQLEDQELPTVDKYGGWIPSPKDFNWSKLPSEPVPVASSNTIQDVITNNNDDRFSTWWTVTHRGNYWVILPIMTMTKRSGLQNSL